MKRILPFAVLGALALTQGTAIAGEATGAGLLVAPQLQDAAPTPIGFEDGIPTPVLAFYKTLSYTAVVLTTDQFWYWAAASQAADTSGMFGVVNTITSPLLTYAFEYGWDSCCEAPPGPDGVVPVSANKAIVYRAISTARVAAVALAFGNSFASSLVVTGAIALTRTGVYLVNDYVWGHIDVRKPAQASPADPADAPFHRVTRLDSEPDTAMR